ncbi:MAG: hypothetical protein ACI3ZP_03920 [Candidatus Cryptobacteroides sp.]
MAHSFTLKADNAKFDVILLPHATLHIYNSGDAMADASYIVEGRDGLVTLETPLFKENLKEFEQYLENLGKPVVAELELLEAMKASGAEYFIGGHGRAADSEDLAFKTAYVEKIKQLLASCADSTTFATVLKEAFPGLPGEDGVNALAEALYK